MNSYEIVYDGCLTKGWGFPWVLCVRVLFWMFFSRLPTSRNIGGVAKHKKNIVSDFLLERVFKSVWKHGPTWQFWEIGGKTWSNKVQHVFSLTGETEKNIWMPGQTMADVWRPMLDIRCRIRFPLALGISCQRDKLINPSVRNTVFPRILEHAPLYEKRNLEHAPDEKSIIAKNRGQMKLLRFVHSGMPQAVKPKNRIILMFEIENVWFSILSISTW